MKKVLSGKLYDTDTAKKINQWHNDCDPDTTDFISETLFQKKTGEYFLLGEGGSSSKYAMLCENNTWKKGECIIPLSFASAKEWAEKHLTPDEYGITFGKIIDEENKTHLCLTLPTASAERVRRLAAEQGISISTFLDSLIPVDD